MTTQSFGEILSIRKFKGWIFRACCPAIAIITFFSGTIRTQENFRFEHISIEQGLSQSSVRCIYQDRQGYMWFGTQDGLNRYNGYSFTVFKHNPSDSVSISNNWINDIYEDRTGTLWISTDNGLNKFNKVTESFIRFYHNPNDSTSINFNMVEKIYEDYEDNLWIGTYGGGLNLLDRKTGTFRHFMNEPDNPKSLNSNLVNTIYEDRSGILWIGSDGGGLNKFNHESESFTHFVHNANETNSLSHNSITAIFEDKLGILWIGTRGGGLNKFDPEKETFIYYKNIPVNPNSINNNDISSIYEDATGKMWIGTDGGGLNVYDREADHFHHYINDPNNPTSLSHNDISEIYEDNAGTLWIGTESKGVNRFNPKKRKFAHFSHDPDNPNSLISNDVSAICEDNKGRVWVGTWGEGLNRLDRQSGKYSHYKHSADNPSSLKDNNVFSIFEDQFGTLWIGTEYALNRYDEKTNQFTHYLTISDHTDDLNYYFVSSINEDQAGDFWIGTFGGGIVRLDRKTGAFVIYNHDSVGSYSLSDNRVYSIYESQGSRDGELWIATYGGGLNRFNKENGNFFHYRHDPQYPNSLSNDDVRSIYQFPNDTSILWIGTNGGLNRFDLEKETFRVYTENDGLPNDVVYGILGDESRNLWMSTNRGLSKFDTRSETFRNYTVSDGLQSMEFNFGAFHKSKSGEMFFGGINGFNVFYPDSITDNPHIPPIVLTDFWIFDKPVKLNQSLSTIQEIEISYHENHYFSFEFAALDYINPEKNRYAYILEGFDEDWIYSGTRRYAGYTHIPGGKYTFKVKGSNNDGIWNKEGVSVQIIIIPHFWETLWFRILIISIIVIAVISGYRFRIRSVQAQKEKLEIEVAERTNELKEARDNLEKRVEERTLELRKSEKGYRNMAQRLLTVQDEERERVAREIHDSMGEYLSTLIVRCGLLKKRKGEDSLAFVKELQEINKLLNEAIDECHRLSFELSPPSISKLGLVYAMKEVIDRFMERSEIPVQFEESINSGRLTNRQELTFFRILQESLNNIHDHAAARNVKVRFYEEDRRICLNISDDGKGFNPDEVTQNESDPYQDFRGFGLMSMRERVESLDGHFKIVSRVDKGTKIIISVPN